MTATATSLLIATLVRVRGGTQIQDCALGPIQAYSQHSLHATCHAPKLSADKPEFPEAMLCI